MQPIIGLEIHIELSTTSKMFCGCKNDPFFAAHPNIYTCPVCLGMPGGLPVPNKKAIEHCILLGLALNCEIALESRFDRKNYFYPDLPKGYQISQYDKPFCENGTIVIASEAKQSIKIAMPSERSRDDKTIRIRRVHMEEDTGKLVHAVVNGQKVSLVDFNRSGVPLVEIVTEPDFRSIDEVDGYVKKLQQIVRYLGISGADMEKGTMRLEPSVSLSEDGSLPDYRVELKNINSFRFVKKALEAEIERQQDPEERIQSTRRYDEKTGKTILMRSKEQAEDYRYFPEPDIPSIRLTRTQISELKSQLPELPDAKRERFINEYRLNDYDATALTQTVQLADYFEESTKVLPEKISSKMIANWLMNKQIDINATVPAQLVEEIRLAREVVDTPIESVLTVIDEIIKREQKAVADYHAGKEQAVMYLFGQVNKELKGKGDKTEILRLLKEKLVN